MASRSTRRTSRSTAACSGPSRSPFARNPGSSVTPALRRHRPAPVADHALALVARHGRQLSPRCARGCGSGGRSRRIAARWSARPRGRRSPGGGIAWSGTRAAGCSGRRARPTLPVDPRPSRAAGRWGPARSPALPGGVRHRLCAARRAVPCWTRTCGCPAVKPRSREERARKRTAPSSRDQLPYDERDRVVCAHTTRRVRFRVTRARSDTTSQRAQDQVVVSPDAKHEPPK